MKQLASLLIFSSILLISSCGKEDENPIQYTIPDTYSFENVSYSGQIQRIQMLSELKAYMKTATSGNSLDATRLQAMYTNDAAKAQWNGTYETSKQLKSKTFELVQAGFEELLEELALASSSKEPGAAGTSGLISSQDGSKTYLIGDDGLDHAQLIEKGLMGACLYYQATGVYMEPERMNVDNETVEPGKGTTMEHHWDEAFGYYGVPVDFPTNKDGLHFWGSYSDQRDAVLGSNQKLMDALLKGRAAIAHKDLATRDEAIEEAQHQWELIAVGSALHYLNSGVAEFNDMALRGHLLSEAVGFIYSLQFNPSKRITNSQINELLNLVAGSSDFDQMNLYTAELTNLQDAKEVLAAYYELVDKMDDF